MGGPALAPTRTLVLVSLEGALGLSDKMLLSAALLLLLTAACGEQVGSIGHAGLGQDDPGLQDREHRYRSGPNLLEDSVDLTVGLDVSVAAKASPLAVPPALFLARLLAKLPPPWLDAIEDRWPAEERERLDELITHIREQYLAPKVEEGQELRLSAFANDEQLRVTKATKTVAQLRADPSFEEDLEWLLTQANRALQAADSGSETRSRVLYATKANRKPNLHQMTFELRGYDGHQPLVREHLVGSIVRSRPYQTFVSEAEARAVLLPEHSQAESTRVDYGGRHVVRFYPLLEASRLLDEVRDRSSIATSSNATGLHATGLHATGLHATGLHATVEVERNTSDYPLIPDEYTPQVLKALAERVERLFHYSSLRAQWELEVVQVGSGGNCQLTFRMTPRQLPLEEVVYARLLQQVHGLEPYHDQWLRPASWEPYRVEEEAPMRATLTTAVARLMQLSVPDLMKSARSAMPLDSAFRLWVRYDQGNASQILLFWIDEDKKLMRRENGVQENVLQEWHLDWLQRHLSDMEKPEFVVAELERRLPPQVELNELLNVARRHAQNPPPLLVEMLEARPGRAHEDLRQEVDHPRAAVNARLFREMYSEFARERVATLSHEVQNLLDLLLIEPTPQLRLLRLGQLAERLWETHYLQNPALSRTAVPGC